MPHNQYALRLFAHFTKSKYIQAKLTAIVCVWVIESEVFGLVHCTFPLYIFLIWQIHVNRNNALVWSVAKIFTLTLRIVDRCVFRCESSWFAPSNLPRPSHILYSFISLNTFFSGTLIWFSLLYLPKSSEISIFLEFCFRKIGSARQAGREVRSVKICLSFSLPFFSFPLEIVLLNASRHEKSIAVCRSRWHYLNICRPKIV